MSAPIVTPFFVLAGDYRSPSMLLLSPVVELWVFGVNALLTVNGASCSTSRPISESSSPCYTASSDSIALR